MSAVKTVNEKDLGTLKNMIQWLDGYAACYNADPFKIEKMVNKKEEEDEISNAWSQVRQDVSDIITLPDTSEEIASANKKVKIYRPLSAILIFGSGLSVLLLSGLRLTPNRVDILVILVVLFAIYATVLSLWYRGTRKLYRMVRDYYKAHGNRASKQRAHLKSEAQRLIDSLTLSVRSGKLDPEKYKMRLLHNDYSNVRILKEETPRNMDRPVYTSVVKARSPTQD
jgi:hypothetical protein